MADLEGGNMMKREKGMDELQYIVDKIGVQCGVVAVVSLGFFGIPAMIIPFMFMRWHHGKKVLTELGYWCKKWDIAE